MSTRNIARHARHNPFASRSVALVLTAICLAFVAAPVPMAEPTDNVDVAVDEVYGVPVSEAVNTATVDPCTPFQDWNEVDSFWMGPWAGDDPYHRHASAGASAGGDWELLRIVLAIGYQHMELLPQWTIESGEHGAPETCSP